MTLRASFLMLVLAFGVFVTPKAAFAWSAFGHLTICDLAYRNTTETTREELDRLFQVDEGGIEVKDRHGTVDRWYTSFNIGCLEEDEHPRKNPKDHFLNISRDTSAITASTCPGTGSCIFEGIERDLEILSDTARSNEDRVFALMAIGHWIGDLHQPLHVSFKDDRGGNKIEVKLEGKCGTARRKPRNLHAMWDFCLLESGLFEQVRQSANFRPEWSKNTITYRAVDLLQDATSHQEEKEIVQGSSWEWANESFEITLTSNVLYCEMKDGVCHYSSASEEYDGGSERKLDLDQSYLLQFEDIASERARFAGLRLAHLINTALDPAYSEPIQNSTQPPN